ncbi:phospholipid-binding lipoprotein MlaA [Azospirillaceae bacterium]
MHQNLKPMADFQPSAQPEQRYGWQKETKRKMGQSFALAVALSLTVAGCATPPSDPAALIDYEKTNDPLEPTNRYVFELNRAADIFVIRPIAEIYRTVLPDPVQDRVRNIIGNMGEPVTFANALLQGRFDDGMTSVGRFLINSTLGIGGIFDVATDFGLPEQHADFGQTLYTWGVGDGPYLVLPLFGPSNPRDALGLGVDTLMDPVGYGFKEGGMVTANYAKTGADGADKRAGYIEPLDAMERNSVDFYAKMRSMSRQHRQEQLLGKKSSSPGSDTYDLYDDPVESKKTSGRK